MRLVSHRASGCSAVSARVYRDELKRAKADIMRVDAYTNAGMGDLWVHCVAVIQNRLLLLTR